MAMTVPAYAESRQLSPNGVYKALARHPEIDAHTFEGISNGKKSKMLDDEAVGMLDRAMKMPYKNTEVVSSELTVMFDKQLQQKDTEISGLKDKLIEEMGQTRKDMIGAVGDAVTASIATGNEEIRADIASLKDNQATQYRILELQNQIEMLERENKSLREEVQELKADLKAERQKGFKDYLFGKKR